MQAIFMVVLTIVFACAPVSGSSAELCPATENHRYWSRACFDMVGTVRQVKPNYVSHLTLNKAGFATIMIDGPRELVAVDQKGVVRIPNIFHTIAPTFIALLRSGASKTVLIGPIDLSGRIFSNELVAQMHHQQCLDDPEQARWHVDSGSGCSGGIEHGRYFRSVATVVRHLWRKACEP
jgi:hypothetical protein